MHLQNNSLMWRPGISSNHACDPVQPYFAKTRSIWALKFILNTRAAHCLWVQLASPGRPALLLFKQSFLLLTATAPAEQLFWATQQKETKRGSFQDESMGKITPSQASKVAVSCRQQGHRLEWQPVPSAQRHPCSPDKGLAPSHGQHSFAEQLQLGFTASHCIVGLMRPHGHCVYKWQSSKRPSTRDTTILRSAC